jgi:hypothetical protein
VGDAGAELVLLGGLGNPGATMVAGGTVASLWLPPPLLLLLLLLLPLLLLLLLWLLLSFPNSPALDVESASNRLARPGSLLSTSEAATEK